MLFIVVDTADTRGSVAALKKTEVLASQVHSSDEDYSSWLLPAVKRVLQASSLTLSELDGYAVCAGPGSFTGLRVGLTTVKAWAEIYDRPIAALSRLEALTIGASNGVSEPSIAASPLVAAYPFIAAYMDARRDQVFAALYRRTKERFELVGEELVTALPDFIVRVASETGNEAVRWITPDPSLIESLAEWPSLLSAGHVLESALPPFAQGLGMLAYRKFIERDTTDALTLDANYVRRSDAELFWKGNKSAFKA